MGSAVDVLEVNRPVPTAAGTLLAKPVPHLIVYAMDRRLTGSFEFIARDEDEAGEIVATLYVSGGLPAKMRTRTPVAYLGQVLYEQGAIDERQLNESLMDVATKKVLQGSSLLASGAIAAGALRTALVEQNARKLRHLCTLPETTEFAFYADLDLLAGWGGEDLAPIDPLPVLWRALRDAPSWPHVRAMLARIERSQCGLSPHAALGRFRFEPDELALAECLRARPMGVHEFTGLGVLVPQAAEILYYTLLITKQIDVVSEPRISVNPRAANNVSVSSAPPPQATRSGSYQRPVSFEPKARVASPGSGAGTSFPESAPFPSATPPASAKMLAARGGLPAPRTGAPPPAASSPPAPTRGSTFASPPPALTRPEPALSSPPPAYEAPSFAYAPASSSSIAPAAPASGQSIPTIAARRQLILERAASLSREDYFQVLGLDRSATPEDAQRAFFRLAEQWHPDRLPPALDDVRDAAGLVFSHLSEAHNALSDERRRLRYVERLQDERAPTMALPSVRPVPGTSNLFEGAEVCASRKEWDRAEALAKKYLEDHPTHGGAMALVAWAQACRMEHAPPEMTRGQIKLLDKALERDWEYERAYYWRALLHRRLGDEPRAIRDFRAAATLNPHNIEAARECRLYEMRRGKKTPGAGTASQATLPGSRAVTPPPEITRSDAPPSSRKTISGLFNKILKR